MSENRRAAFFGVLIGVLFLFAVAGAAPLDYAAYYLPVHEWEPAEALPEKWGEGPEGWRFFKRLDLRNPTAIPRPNEPVEVDVEFHADQVRDLAREVRVIEVVSDAGPLREVPSQIHLDPVEDGVRYGRLFFLADLGPQEQKTYLVFYGNPDSSPPAYATDLQVSGEEYALDIENTYYRVELARSMGHLKSLFFKPGGPALVGHGPPMTGAHGTEGTIHWNPDWSDEYTGRYRVTNWTRPPHYEVIRGPVCVRLRRWGHPILALGPEVGRPHKVMATVTYTFYAEVPYILMESRLEVLEEVRFRDCRNDEWVGLGGWMPDIAWMMKGGEIGFGPKSWNRQNPAWMTCFNKESGHGFATLRLDYECTHPDWHEPASVSISNGLWVRYPLHHAIMRRGDFVREKNAYLLHRYEPPREQGFGMLMDYYRRLSSPLVQEQTPPGAAKALTVPHVLDALRACYDAEVYIRGSSKAQRMLNVVDLGLVRDVEIIGGQVHLKVIMPYEGRETWFGWFASMMEEQIRQRIEGVESVKVEQVREPAWSPEQMSLRARRLLGLPEVAETPD